MANTASSIHLLDSMVLVFFLLIQVTSYCYADSDERKVYIVYMGSLPEGNYSPTWHHTSILEEILENSSVSDSLVRSYKRSFNGFAAKLTRAEKERLESRGEVVSIFESRSLKPLTSKSWDFMGLIETSKRNPSVESDTIIGVIDTGLWLDSPSFTDDTFSPPPKKWRGLCAGGANFTCNNKVIGARYYPTSSAIDTIGHGSHTTSIAAGNRVADVSFFGVGSGTARGGVPSARIAVYSVCTSYGCQDMDILSAFDDAISDGVDIITISIGTNGVPYALETSIAIGSFHAMAKSILTTQAAGNAGPKRGTVCSVAPWLFTVAASNTYRRFVDKVVLGNRKEFIGNSINSFSLKEKNYPIVFGQEAGKKCHRPAAESCDCLDSRSIKGKIVLCSNMQGYSDASLLGAAGVIFEYKHIDHSLIAPFSAAILSTEDFNSVLSYYNSSKYPTATILKSEGLKVGSPPEVASFSSRGPNNVIRDILKPDITAPGVDILAAYSMQAQFSSKFPLDTRRAKYSVSSGTSMACPHVAGAAAYVKSFHPTWSPAAIKSALMTTARAMHRTNASDYEFGYGSGNIDPVKAVDPGLVYNTTKEDYVEMLCNIGYDKRIRLISGDKSTRCPKKSGKTMSFARDLNYPSMSTTVKRGAGVFKITFKRRVTNVGDGPSVYKSTVISNNEAIKVMVEPNVMTFKSIGERKTFVVIVTGLSDFSSIFSASLVWSDNVHRVHSPIVLYHYDI